MKIQNTVSAYHIAKRFSAVVLQSALLFFILTAVSNLHAQEDKKISFTTFIGMLQECDTNKDGFVEVFSYNHDNPDQDKAIPERQEVVSVRNVIRSFSAVNYPNGTVVTIITALDELDGKGDHKIELAKITSPDVMSLKQTMLIDDLNERASMRRDAAKSSERNGLIDFIRRIKVFK